MAYNFTAIEKKWQAYWLTNKSFAALDPADAAGMPKAFVLDMFPYPSGAGLHVGHPEGYTATDIYSRYLRARGFNVLHPMGWDAFGLPAEQYAIKHNVHPAETTATNIANFRRQIQSLGLSYDWDREVDTTDPGYYKWTQWIFLQLFNSFFDPAKNKAMPIGHLIAELENENYLVGPDGSVIVRKVMSGLEEVTGEVRIERLWRELSAEEQREVIDGARLAYMDEIPVNWCAGLGTVLSNEEVIDGKSHVGGFPVERRPMRQWMLRITAYADRLVDDLSLLEWPESLKEMQRNWIGKSIGAEIDFAIAEPTDTTTDLDRIRDVIEDADDDLTITVFTTRPDTLYGATYMVLAPEHPLVDRITPPAHRETVEAYRTVIGGKSDRDRMADTKDKTGVFIGAYAVNPINFEKLPIYIADYVLMGYGTGAIMAVPAHDDRDHAFAKKFDLPIREVVSKHRPVETTGDQDAGLDSMAVALFTGEGYAINSPIIKGLPTAEAKEKIIADLAADGLAYKTTKYKLRDWLFSRQRYWGEPFPIVLDEAGNAYPIPETDLPLTLPEIADFKPTGTAAPPLSKAKSWLPYAMDHQTYTRETNTMPQWAGSCWYYLRYIDPTNTERFVDPEKEKYWMPVDLYVGGVEHAVLHLLYARFWHKVLFDLGHVSTPEPFRRLVNQGLILGEMEAYVFVDSSGKNVSTTDVRDIDEQATSDGLDMIAVHKQTGEKLIGRRVAEDQVEKQGDGYVLKSDRSIRVDARSFKMSKSRGNVVNPDDIVKDYGADAFRLYEMYMGPLEAQKPWSTRDIVGMTRFLAGVYRNLIGDDENMPATTTEPGGSAAGSSSAGSSASIPAPTRRKIVIAPIPPEVDRLMHRTIKKVGDDIAALRFNTAIAELIVLNKTMTAMTEVPRELAENFTLLLAPFAPHLAEELWLHLGHHKSLTRRPWPTFDEAKLVESSMDLPVQVNGKLRDKITVPADADDDTIFAAAAAAEKVIPWIAGKDVKKRLYVPKKLVNFVVG
jgi:leucyl-tRNA synthetase